MTPADAISLDDLIAAVCHGVATDEQMRDLAARLAEDTEARAAYLRQVDLHATLAADDTVFSLAGDAATEGGGLALPLPTLTRPASPVKDVRTQTPVFLVAAALVLGGLVIAALVFRPWAKHSETAAILTSDPALEEETDGPTALATITRTVDARWRGSEPLPDIAEPRSLELASGLAQIECGTGAVLVAEGPFKAEILSDSAVRLDHGKLRINVPPQATGFTLYTPELKIIDIGTDFAVQREADGPGEIHVFEGEIEIVPEGGKRNEAQRLTAGEARTFDFLHSGHRLVTRPVNPSAFLGIREIDERAHALHALQFTEWQTRTDALSADPALQILFTFSGHESWERTVRNLAPLKRPQTDGALVGCQWTRGRWAEKDALDFHRPGDRVRLHVGATADAFTLMAWVYLPANATPRPRTLFSAVPFGAIGSRAPEWQLTRDGGISLNLKQHPEDRSLGFRQNEVLARQLAPGWRHLAVTGSRNQEVGQVTVRFYVDGREVFEKTKKDNAPLAFGRCDIGNSIPVFRETATVDAKKKAARRGTFPFVGIIDEFALLTRALAQAEIEDLWRAGAQIPLAE